MKNFHWVNNYQASCIFNNEVFFFFIYKTKVNKIYIFRNQFFISSTYKNKRNACFSVFMKIYQLPHTFSNIFSTNI